jgi:hypothetical protein
MRIAGPCGRRAKPVDRKEIQRNYLEPLVAGSIRAQILSIGVIIARQVN